MKNGAHWGPKKVSKDFQGGKEMRRASAMRHCQNDCYWKKRGNPAHIEEKGRDEQSREKL